MTPLEFNLTKAAYTVKESQLVLSIGTNTFYELIRRGYIKPVKLGKKTLIYAGDLADVLRRLREDPTFYRDRTRTSAETKERLAKSREEAAPERKARKLAEAEDILAAVGVDS